MPERRTLSRDELSELLGVPTPTLYSWWAKGHIPPPKSIGGAREQAEFTKDEAFYIAVYAKAVQEDKRKLKEAAPAAHYLAARPGTLDILTTWQTPLIMSVYPHYRLAAVQAPSEQIERRTKAADKARNKRIEEAREPGARPASSIPGDDEYWLELDDAINFLGKLDEFSPSELLRLARLVSAIWFEAGYYQRGENAPAQGLIIGYIETGWTPKFPSDVPLSHRLLREAQGIKYLPHALKFDPYTLEFRGEKSPHYTLDVTPVIEAINKAFLR